MPGILIADRGPLERSAIARIVASERPGLGPLAEARSGDEAVAVAGSMRPDVVLLDITIAGSEAGARLRAAHPAVKLVVLAARAELTTLRQALRLGAADCLLKPVRPAQLVEALDAIQAQLASEQGAAQPEAATPLARALAHMRHNLHRADLRLGEVAAAARVSPSHLAALIRRRLGRSYLAHLTLLRMERARELLVDTELTVAAVAASVGYATPAPFYQRFKRGFGVTPAAYREGAARHG